MTNLLFTIVALAIASYGFLVIVGRGPGTANKVVRALGRVALAVIHAIVRVVVQVSLAVLASMIEFVFNRPRR